MDRHLHSFGVAPALRPTLGPGPDRPLGENRSPGPRSGDGPLKDAETRRPELNDRWLQTLSLLDYAFQPIVNSHSGVCFAFEALLRETERAGFADPQDLLDTCAAEGVLAEVDARLREMAVAKFSTLPFATKVKLFVNVDNRVIDRLTGPGGSLAETMASRGLHPSGVIFEISERHPVRNDQTMMQTLERIKAQGLNIAIDDFGVGFSGLQLLYRVEPNYVKVDRFFIDGIDRDTRKRHLLSHIVNMARLLGISVIAEGVQSEREFLTCKELGCDLIQGYLVQAPTADIGALRMHYEEVEVLSARERRRKTSDYQFIKDKVQPLEPLHVETSMLEVLQMFSDRPRLAYFPVVDSMGVPVGVVREADVKYYVYSRFGRDLLSNPSSKVSLEKIVWRCPVVDVNSRAEHILEVFSIDNPAQCAIVTENRHYVGTLDAQSLLGILTEKSLTIARDQNPLTRMPGNTLIEEFVSQSLMNTTEDYLFVYFDFDHFKPFNDRYGFRVGDRAILMFSEIMRRILRAASFTGHIGGDDFFAGFQGAGLAEAMPEIGRLQNQFTHEVRSLYGVEARTRGFILGEDRDGRERAFPLLSVSAAVLRVPAGRDILTTEEVVQLMSALKKEAKQSPDRLASATIGG
ncbi:MAG: EAL domain-containing protein [Alphaproteobacteria bacterium]|nr:EAL domain-containing protein [Alphaproteobacteria bacterium]